MSELLPDGEGNEETIDPLDSNSNRFIIRGLDAADLVMLSGELMILLVALKTSSSSLPLSALDLLMPDAWQPRESFSSTLPRRLDRSCPFSRNPLANGLLSIFN